MNSNEIKGLEKLSIEQNKYKHNDNQYNILIGVSENVKLENRIIENKRKMQEVQDGLVGKLEYNKFIILYDLMNKSYYQISSDIKKNKITLNDVIEVIEKANNINDIFDKNLIMDSI